MMALFKDEYPLIQRDRIILRRPDFKDIHELKNLFDQSLDEETAGKMTESFAKAWKEGSEYILGIISAYDEKLKGIIEIYDHDGKSVSIGYRILKEYRNLGYAKDAVYVLTHHLCEKEGIETVNAASYADNEASCAILRHNGFEQTEEKEGKIFYAYHKAHGSSDQRNLEKGLKEIYCAGGCFWGAEKAFRMLDGVKETWTGYANGTIDNPRYEDVCRGDTGYRETVRIVYDPNEVSLSTIMKAFFLCIDPTVRNRQGNDIGSQYQTGVYYTDEEDLAVIVDAFEEEKKKHDRFYVELKPLMNFWSAEEYHQKYLDKHPFGYCHITKIEFDAVKALNNGRK